MELLFCDEENFLPTIFVYTKFKMPLKGTYVSCISCALWGCEWRTNAKCYEEMKFSSLPSLNTVACWVISLCFQTAFDPHQAISHQPTHACLRINQVQSTSVKLLLPLLLLTASWVQRFDVLNASSHKLHVLHDGLIYVHVFKLWSWSATMNQKLLVLNHFRDTYNFVRRHL
jgi:hypothetical protein